MAQVTIPQEMGSDPFYRYMRPKITCEYIRKHGGCTHITNFEEVCAKIYMTPCELRQRLQRALSAKLSKDYILRGILNADELDIVLEQQVIIPCVICPVCNNPETGIGGCKACGAPCPGRFIEKVKQKKSKKNKKEKGEKGEKG